MLQDTFPRLLGFVKSRGDQLILEVAIGVIKEMNRVTGYKHLRLRLYQNPASHISYTTCTLNYATSDRLETMYTHRTLA
jgi:hypothetical protein